MKEYQVLRMYSPQLKREKRIFLYLPKSYHYGEESYPVLYMHDGQNLFDDITAHHKRGWRIVDMMEDMELPEVIIVGIENGGTKRTDELIPYEFCFDGDEKTYGGHADAYLDFIVDTVKPYVDDRFRTLPGSKHTAIMGSSFGGVNSFYAAIEYAGTFSRFGCVSNAFFYGFYDKLKDLALAADFAGVRKLYMDFGTKESSTQMENDQYMKTNEELFSIVRTKLPKEAIRFDVIEGAKHHERDWEVRFPEILRYLFTD